MKKLLLTTTMLLVLSYSVHSKEKKGYNRLIPEFGLQYYFDRGHVRFLGTETAKYLLPRNTFGQYLGLQYERVTRYGLTYSAGLQYGIRRYNLLIHWEEPLPSGAYITYENPHEVNVRYWSYQLMLGYRKLLSKDLAAVIKIGAYERSFFDGSRIKSLSEFTYEDKNRQIISTGGYIYFEERFGRDPSFNKKGFLGRNRFPAGLFSFDVFLGVEKQINHGIVKNMTIGIEGGRNFSTYFGSDRFPSDGELNVSVRHINSLKTGDAFFYDHNLTLGLRISAGLWK